jgi:hypothetical protein
MALIFTHPGFVVFKSSGGGGPLTVPVQSPDKIG